MVLYFFSSDNCSSTYYIYIYICIVSDIYIVNKTNYRLLIISIIFFLGKSSSKQMKREIKDDIELLSIEYSEKQKRKSESTETDIVKNLQGMFGKYLH